ncbi:MAG: hypothetical protein ACD_20C00278G0001 [uncultured bacterium]|nr:MAG: hypothetical protein ACD_20C00278G0001 [uncultured bacterium]
MKLIKFCFVCLFLINSVLFASSNTNKYSVQTYYSLASEAFEKYDWKKVIGYCLEIIKNYPESSFTKESLFYLGVAYFNLRDNEASNKYFTKYLKDDFNPKYFEETMHYKYSIAENFKNGAKKRLFGLQKGPKILGANDEALVLFDEIIASMPMHELAAKSMFAKGQLLVIFEEYKDSIATFEQLIEKFEKHELAVESYIEIGRIYLKRTTYKTQDMDMLELSELNLEKLTKHYPNESQKIKELEKIVLDMKEKFAEGFLTIAKFYENTNKKEAAKIYYLKILNAFSNTNASKIAQKKLDKLNEN